MNFSSISYEARMVNGLLPGNSAADPNVLKTTASFIVSPASY
jgi:hypothetical protein